MITALKVEVPIACFRVSRAREYAQTYPVPPPATVYGMLLSMVGEMDRYRHCGIKLAIALLNEPEKSTILRTFRRFKKKQIFDPTNARPDYQELLSDIQFIVWVASGTDKAQPTLCQRLTDAIANPETVDRFGGLSLGESRDLVNGINLLPEDYRGESLRWLVQQQDGLLTLPYWVDHVGSKGTRWQRFQLLPPSEWCQPPDNAWIEIRVE
jgi:CRISPR-associated protein Cas5t